MAFLVQQRGRYGWQTIARSSRRVVAEKIALSVAQAASINDGRVRIVPAASQVRSVAEWRRQYEADLSAW